MKRVLVLIGLLASLSTARAIEDVATTPVSYNGTAPTGTNITNWATGWTQPAVQPTGYTSTTGWNYVGSVNGNSAVYLGNGWVLTAAHVGVSDLSLNGVIYPMVPNSTKTFGSADLILFQVSPAPALPSIPIRATAPKPTVCQTAMIGWGHANGDRSPTWGYNTVTYVTTTIQLANNGVNYSTTDFLTLTQGSSGNNYQVVEGDSGGAAFIFNSTTQMWELAGVNEAMVSNNGVAPFYSALVQLSAYQPQIAAAMTPVTDTPALPPWAMGLLAGTLAWVASPMCTVRRSS
jgi:hypothetical protein